MGGGVGRLVIERGKVLSSSSSPPPTYHGGKGVCKTSMQHSRVHQLPYCEGEYCHGNGNKDDDPFRDGRSSTIWVGDGGIPVIVI